MAEPKKKVKAKTKTRGKTKVRKIPPAPSIDKRLTEVEKFYIRGNSQVLAPEAIAKNLGVAVDDVVEFIRVNPPDQRESRISTVLDRPAKRGGVVCMTEAGSMMADEGFRGVITQAEINRASSAGDYKLAAELQQKKDQQMLDAKAAEAARNAGRWHYIRPVGVGETKDGR